jgi:isopentenyl phosphate kinase
MKSKSLILIKLGGSTITDKNIRKKAEIEKIRQLAKEISEARKKTEDLIIISHGQGSFAHFPASEFKTKDGFIDDRSPLGLSKVRQECIELNLLIISELIKANIPAVTIEPFAVMSTTGKKLNQVFLQPFINVLNRQMVPIVYGDTLSDSEIGCTIYSGETILNILALKLQDNFKINKVIEVGKTDGVYDENGETITEINKQNIFDVRKKLSGSHGTDVTGGMLHKVDEAFQLSEKGIETLLIGSDQGSLEKAILNQPVLGTWIR